MAVGLIGTLTVTIPIGRTAVSQGATAKRPDLQRIIDRLVTGRGRIAPGVTAYVAGPRGTWVGAAGMADAAARRSMRPDARMRLESVSKLWVATLILQLVGEHRMHLDDTVARWLPGLLPYGDRITVRELLNHTTGMIDSNDLANDPTRYLRQVKDPALRAKILRVAHRLERNPGYEFSSRLYVEWAAALPLQYAPGTTYRYSNIGYVVAGMIAERVGQAGLATLTRRRITQPLHLTASAYDPHTRIAGAHAHGYRVAGTGKLTDATTWTEGLGANGGIVSDAADEAHFLQALMRGHLLTPAELTALKTPPAVPAVVPYALGTGVDPTACGTAYGHAGGGAGFETNVYVSGDGSRVAVLLLNGRTADSHGDAIAGKAARRLYCAG